MLEQAPLAPRCARGRVKGVCVLSQACMAGHLSEPSSAGRSRGAVRRRPGRAGGMRVVPRPASGGYCRNVPVKIAIEG